MAVFNEWRPAREGEERIDFESGLAVVLYRQGGRGEYLFRLAGWTHPSKTTGTTDVVEARKRALRRADLVLRQAIDQVAATLVTLGTGFN